MVKKALYKKYREKREKDAKKLLFLSLAYRIGWALWVVGVLVLLIVIYLRYH